MKVLTVAGTRPEFIRLALVFGRLAEAGIEHHLIHTGQNFDERLSDIFFAELEIPAPQTYLGIRSDRVGDQIGQIIAGTERIMLAERPDALLILGDTNSGLAAVAAAHHGIPIFHMEAGNRCFDWSVPEEKNRKLIDHVSTWLLPYTMRSREYLLREGIAAERILVSGNPITDIIEHYRPLWEASDVIQRLSLEDHEYVLVTAHRKETVDIPSRLRVICDGLDLVAREFDLPLVWSVHPRTRSKLAELGMTLDSRIQMHEPFGFVDFVRLEAGARCVVTDSGTVQEECSLLGVPVVTCRDTTERPETVECGSNVLSGVERSQRILECVALMVDGPADWVSPYQGPMHRNVAEKVVKFIVGNTR